MLKLRKGSDRGYANHGWLETYHSFSFADYYDPEFMGFSALRVINDDRIHPNRGFGEHGHKDMEIVTYVISGELAHRDSMGNGSVIKPGEVQYMSAGAGVTHSEFNHSTNQVTRLVQIWILPSPSEKGAKPRYDQKSFSEEDKKKGWRLLVSQKGDDGSIAIRQDAKIYATVFENSEERSFSLDPARNYWIQVLTGDVSIHGHNLSEGDGLALTREDLIVTQGNGKPSEVLLFDLPPFTGL